MSLFISAATTVGPALTGTTGTVVSALQASLVRTVESVSVTPPSAPP